MKIIRSIVSLVLAALVFVSATSFTVSMHICMGQVRSIALLHDADNCGMGSMDEAQPEAERIDWNSCCKDQTVVFDGNEYNVKVTEKTQADSFTPVMFILPRFISALFEDDAPAFTSYSPYKPPLIDRNIPVLVQSFLL